MTSLERHAAAIARPWPMYPVDKQGRVVRVPRPGDPYPIDRSGRVVKPLPWGDADTLSFLSYPRPTRPAPPLPPSCRPKPR